MGKRFTTKVVLDEFLKHGLVQEFHPINDGLNIYVFEMPQWACEAADFYHEHAEDWADLSVVEFVLKMRPHG